MVKSPAHPNRIHWLTKAFWVSSKLALGFPWDFQLSLSSRNIYLERTTGTTTGWFDQRGSECQALPEPRYLSNDMETAFEGCLGVDGFTGKTEHKTSSLFFSFFFFFFGISAPRREGVSWLSLGGKLGLHEETQNQLYYIKRIAFISSHGLPPTHPF